MLCTLTLAKRAGAKRPTSACFMMIPKKVLIVRLNHYQGYTAVIFKAIVAADLKLDGNGSDCNKHIPVFTYSMS